MDKASPLTQACNKAITDSEKRAREAVSAEQQLEHDPLTQTQRDDILARMRRIEDAVVEALDQNPPPAEDLDQADRTNPPHDPAQSDFDLYCLRAE